jgi:hypothetical protein
VELPVNAYIEFDYNVRRLFDNMPSAPVLSGISLVDEAGARYRIEWGIYSQYGNWYQQLKPPGGDPIESNLGYRSADGGTVQISLQSDKVSVQTMDGCKFSGTAVDFKKFIRFEVDLYAGQNIILYLTNFKIGKLSSQPGSTREEPSFPHPLIPGIPSIPSMTPGPGLPPGSPMPPGPALPGPGLPIPPSRGPADPGSSLPPGPR